MSKPPAVIPWSYTSLTGFETCPRRFYLTRIARVVSEPQTQATIHGNAVHKALEEYVGGKAPMPVAYEKYVPIADRIKAAKGQKLLEYRFGLTRSFQPTTFFDRSCWGRGVLDVGVVQPESATLLDYKTGKRKADMDQLAWFALAGLAHWPHAKKVKTGYIWLQSGQMDTGEFTQDDKPRLAQEFSARVHKLEVAFQANTWEARPSGLCREWCPVGRSNCDHCGK